jgi:hypothetical protein
MRALSQALTASLQASGVIEHALTKGEIREKEVAKAFEPYMPTQFSLGSGLVINAEGKQSKQQDLIVSDRHIASPFFAKGDQGIHPIETVRGVVEVKSQSTKKEIREAVKGGASVSGLVPHPHWGWGPDGNPVVQENKPFTGIICLQVQGSIESAAKAFAEANLELPPYDRTYCLLLLGRALVTWKNEQNQLVGPHENGELWGVEYGDDALMIFYSGMLRGMWQYQPPPFGLYQYIAASQFHEGGKMWRVEVEPST